MKKRLFIIFAALILLPIAASALEDIDKYKTIEISIRQEASVVAVPGTHDVARIDYVQANISLYPQEYGGQVIAKRDVLTIPQTSVEYNNGNMILYWKDPTDYMFKYNINTDVTMINHLDTVKFKLPFPYGSYDGGAFGRGITEYTRPSESVDSNEAIRKLSSGILEGETDYYRAVFKLGKWVNENINYTLDTMTENAVQKASWVLENRYGVCDEISTLFMALLRSANIPVRFVAGQAYSYKESTFGSHGWTEVYFPGIGWVPFDVTFSQFGWVDPTHVKLDDELDPAEPSVGYSWRADDAKMNINPMSVKADIINAYGEMDELASLKVVPLRETASNGSYMPIRIIVKNLQPYYLPVTVSITKAPELLEKNSKPVLLEPYEEKSLFWIVAIQPNITGGYKYTTVVEATSQFSKKVSSTIAFAEDNEYFSRKWAEETVSRLAPREEKSFIPSLGFECAPEKGHYYRHETANIKCAIKNEGNTNFSPLKTCLETECKDVELLIGETKEVEWSIPLEVMNSSDFVVTAESLNMIKYAYPNINIIETPKIEIIDFNPKTIEYGADADLVLLMKSDNEARNITIDIAGLGYSSLNRLEEAREIVIPFNSKTFRKGNVAVEVAYYDALGKRYTDNYAYTMVVTDMPWYSRLAIWVEGFLPFVRF